MDAETQEIRQARQRASVKWLLSKAFNNRVPENIKEPFFRDHENHERLKPQIIIELGNATLYCQTLSNLFSDPNYQNLNHWSILQTLTRKGVPAAASNDMPLTETVLIQTNPLRINAHMSVIESLMLLYAKEITAGDRINQAIRRISGNQNYQPSTNQNYEQALLAWVSHVCAALKRRAERQAVGHEMQTNGIHGQRIASLSELPPVRDFQDLCDGVCMALLVAFYCPKWLNWTQVRINYLPAVEDSIHNMSLLSAFSQQCLPCNVFHMTPDDITYMRGSMKTNLLALLADLFNFFEIHPAECVSYPEMESTDVIAKRHAGANEHGLLHRRGLTTQPVIPIPDLRSESVADSTHSSPSHRPIYQVMCSASTNSSTVMAQKFTTSPTEKLQQQMVERKNCDTSEDFVVHKSRGITTLSSMQIQQLQQQQQDPLVPARLRQAKEKTNYETKADERGDNVPAGRPSNWEQTRRPSFAGRRSRRNSSSEDSQLTIENFGGSQDQLNNFGRFSQERERERDRERKSSTASIEPVVPLRSSLADARGSIQLGYDTDSGSEKQDRDTEKYSNNHNNKKSINNDSSHESHGQTNHAGGISMVGSPVPSVQVNTNTKIHSTEKDYDPYDDDLRSLESASKLSNIRNKLEEKRRRIEHDKRRIELALMKHQGKDEYSEHMGGKWETMSNDSKRSPDLDGMDLDKYQQSIAIMNMNLQDIQQDIQRLATQQSQIQAQTLQAQQLIQAQQIANMLNQQQTYGSQQHLAEHYQRHLPALQAQSNYGSTPHLPQMLQQQQQQQMNSYVGSRPPSRDSYQQQQQAPQHMQYINENGQYMSPQHQQQQFQSQQQQQQPQSHYMSPPIYAEPTTTYNNHHLMQRNYDDYPTQHHHAHHAQQFYNDANVTAPSGGQSNNHLYEIVHPPQRRTWANTMYDEQQQQMHPTQQQQQSMVDVNAWQSVKRGNQQLLDDSIYNTKRMDGGGSTNVISGGGNAGGGFILHQNGGGEYQHLFQVQASPQRAFSSSSPTTSTVKQQQTQQQQHQNVQLQQQHQQQSKSIGLNNNNGMQQPPNSSDDMMAPQSICFIGDEEDVDEIERNICDAMQSTRISQNSMMDHQSAHIQRNSNDQRQQQQHGVSGGRESSSEDYGSSSEMISRKLNITSGNLTYRIPSPSRPPLQNNSFQDPQAEKGFYISFDDEQPKRPKPPLRTKRSPKKEKSLDSVDHQAVLVKRESLSQLHNISNINNNRIGDNNHTNNNSNNGKKSHDANNHNNSNATYNKYTDMPLPASVSLRQLNTMGGESVSLERLNNANVTTNNRQNSTAEEETKGKALIIGTDVAKLDPESVDEMERRKEKIMLLSLQRRQQQEEAKARKEIEASQQREREREKEEERARKKEEQMARRAAILEQHRLKKAIEEAEREGKILERPERQSSTTTPRLRQQRNMRPRPKTIHVDDASVDISEASSISSSRGKKGSSTNLTGQYGHFYGSNAMRRDLYKGSQDSLITKASPEEFISTSSTPVGRRGSYKSSREPTAERGRTLSRISVAKGSTLHLRGRKSNSLMNLCGRFCYASQKQITLLKQSNSATDSGLGRATPPRRAASPGMAMGGGITSTSTGRHMPSPSGPGSLPPGLVSKRRIFDDGSSDISSNQFSMVEYSGPKLYKQPASKSNRGIILNAVEYCVFPGAVNRDAKQKVLEKIARSEAKHFLVLFRDAGCQFRALYSYVPEAEQIFKLYGTGPSQVDEGMFDKFFKYNSGGKCFSQVHTKHLTVTIDAFTIHNSLWQGKRVNLPSKKDMALVI